MVLGSAQDICTHCGRTRERHPNEVLDCSFQEVDGSWPDNDLANWTRGLSRWGKLVLVRGAWVAGMACLPKWEADPFSHGIAARQALESTKAWLDCPCDAHAQAAQQVMDWRHEGGPTDNATAWWNNPAAICHISHPDALTSAGELALERAASYPGEAAVRGMVCRELVRWALGDERRPAE